MVLADVPSIHLRVYLGFHYSLKELREKFKEILVYIKENQLEQDDLRYALVFPTFY